MFAHNFYCLWMFPKALAINSSENLKQKTRNLLIFSPISAFRRLSPHLWAIKNKNYISCVTPVTCIVLKRTDPILLMRSIFWDGDVNRWCQCFFVSEFKWDGLESIFNGTFKIFFYIAGYITGTCPQFHSYVVGSFTISPMEGRDNLNEFL